MLMIMHMIGVVLVVTIRRNRRNILKDYPRYMMETNFYFPLVITFKRCLLQVIMVTHQRKLMRSTC